MGRRVKMGEDRRNPINSRIRDELRTRLERAAKISGRTLSHEIEERLERSFDEQDHVIKTFYNIENLAMATAIANAWNFIDVKFGKSWMSSPETIEMAKEVTVALLSIANTERSRKDLSENVEPRESRPDSILKMTAYTALCLTQGIEPYSNIRKTLPSEHERILDALKDYY